MTKIQKAFIFAVMVGAIGLSVVASTNKVPPLIAPAGFLGATPSTSSPLRVTSTSAAYFVPLGYNRLTCTTPTYYALESSSSGTALTTDAVAPGPQVVNNVAITRSVWVNVTSDQWLALLKKGTGVDGFCIVELGSVDGVSGSFTTLAASGATTLSSTLAVTGAATLGGAITTGSTVDAGSLNVVGQTTLQSTLNVAGASTLTGALSAASTSALTGVVTTGAAVDAGALNVVGQSTFQGLLSNAGDNIGASTKTRGTGALNNASPSVYTATVNTGAICVCANNTTQTVSVKCAVSGTTLTITGPNTTTDTVSYICIQ